MTDKHDRVREQFDRISATWPHTDRLDLPEPEDLDCVLRDIADVDVPELDLVQLTDHARRALQAAGEFQHGRTRGRRKRSGESQSARHPSAFTIADLALDKKRPCA